MSDLKLNLSIREENGLLFKRCVRKLLASTFIVGDKDERLYAFVSRESNRQDLSDYLRMIGFDVAVDNRLRIAMLRVHDADEETVGLKQANVVRFSTEQYHLLLVLWQVYLENFGNLDEDSILSGKTGKNIITLGDLVDKIQAYGVGADKGTLWASLKLFKKYDLLNYDAENRSEESEITLYPSLQFGWDEKQFRIVADEYLRKAKADNETDGAEGTEV